MSSRNRASGSRAVVTLLAAAVLAHLGCGGDPPPSSSGPTEQVDRAAAPLLGNTDYMSSCRPTVLPHLREALHRGRIAAASAAFRQCLGSALTVATTYDPGWTVGPYRACTDDQAPTTLTTLLSVLQSDRSVSVTCEEGVLPTGEGGRASLRSASRWHEPVMVGNSLAPFLRCEDNADPSCVGDDAYSKAANTLYHEVMHTHGYNHMEGAYTCGASDPALGYGNGIPYIVGGCVEMVLRASDRLCVDRPCGVGSRRTIVGFRPDGTADAGPFGVCTCVGDPGMSATPDVVGFTSRNNRAAVFNSGSAEQQFLAADFDGDGLTDVAQSFRGWSTIPLCRARAVGGWTCSNTAAAIRDSGSSRQQFLTGDFDADHHAEVLSTGSSTSYSTYKWTGTGWTSRMVPATVYDSGSPAQRTLTGDFDGDGSADVFQAYYGWGSVPVCMSRDLGGRFDCINPGAVVYVEPQSDFLTGDFDGDGRTDLFQAYRGWNSIPVCKSTGTGFDCSNLSATVYDSSSPEQKFLTGDFNGDGRTDVAQVYRGWHSIPVCLSQATGWSCSNPPADIFDAGSDEQQFIATDVNGDGRTDIVQTFRGWHTHPVCFSTGSGWSCSNPPADVYDSGSSEERFLAGDVNGDLRGDILSVWRGPASGKSGWSTLPVAIANKHQVKVVLENVDDTGRVWQGANDDTLGILDVDRGPYPRSGSLDLTPIVSTSSVPVRFTVMFGNGGGGAASGTVRFEVDGREVFTQPVTGTWGIYGWFYRRQFDVDYATGLVTAL